MPERSPKKPITEPASDTLVGGRKDRLLEESADRFTRVFPELPVPTESEAPQENLDPSDFESEQMCVLFGSFFGGTDANRLLTLAPSLINPRHPTRAGEVATALLFNPAFAGSLVLYPAGVIAFYPPIFRRWLWLLEWYQRVRRLRMRIRRIVNGDLSGEEKTERIQTLLDDFWNEVALPLGPNGLRYDGTTRSGYVETSRGAQYGSDFDLSDLLKKAVGRVLATVVNATFGFVLRRVGIDAGEIIGDSAAAFVGALDLSGHLYLESAWSQLWVFPVDRANEARAFIDGKSRPALRVATRIADAPSPQSFAAGAQLDRLDAEIAPILNLLSRMWNEPGALVRDLLTGQFNPDDVSAPSPREIQSAVSRLVTAIEDLASAEGLRCDSQRTPAGNRIVLRRTCVRTIYFELLAGPERPVVGPAWPGAIEIFPVAAINVFVLPESSDVFLKHHGLFYHGSLEASYRTDLENVLKQALESLARTLLQKVVDKIRDALTPDALRDLIDSLR